jgi:hypothetical protein
LGKVLLYHQFFTNQKCFIITGAQLGYLTAFLNSKIFRFAFKEYFPELLGNTRELSKVFFELVTVIPVTEEVNNAFDAIVDQIQNLKAEGKETASLEQQIEEMLAAIYSLSADDMVLINSGTSASPATVDRIKERSASVNS